MRRTPSPRRFPSPLRKEHKARKNYRERYAGLENPIAVINKIKKLKGINLDFGYIQLRDHFWQSFTHDEYTKSGVCFALALAWLKQRIQRENPESFYSWIAPNIPGVSVNVPDTASGFSSRSHFQEIQQLMQIQSLINDHIKDIQASPGIHGIGRLAERTTVNPFGVHFKPDSSNKETWNTIIELADLSKQEPQFLDETLGLSSKLGAFFGVDEIFDYEKWKLMFFLRYFGESYHDSHLQHATRNIHFEEKNSKVLKFHLFDESTDFIVKNAAIRIAYALDFYLKGKFTSPKDQPLSRIFAYIVIRSSYNLGNPQNNYGHALAVTVEKDRKDVKLGYSCLSGTAPCDVYSFFDPNLGIFYSDGISHFSELLELVFAEYYQAINEFTIYFFSEKV